MDHSGSGSKTASQWLEPGCVPGVSSGKNTGGGASSGGGAGGPVRLVFATNCYCKHSLLTQGQPALPAPNTTTTQHRISAEERRGQAGQKLPTPGNNKARQQQQHNMILRRRKGREKVIATKSRTKTQQQQTLWFRHWDKEFLRIMRKPTSSNVHAIQHQC